MSNVVYVLKDEVRRTLRRPSRILKLLVPSRVRARVDNLALKIEYGETWRTQEQKFMQRDYAGYEAYLAHQRAKLPRIAAELVNYDVSYRSALRERLAKLPFLERGLPTLCLAARLGTEVKAFIDVGCFAVGIDLNPGEANRHVVVGDFHNLQFADDSVRVVFTNSLDHAFDLERILAEVKRVLSTGGLFITEVGRGVEEGSEPGFYESFWWSDIDELASRIAEHGFELMNRVAFEYPWNGEQLTFRVVKA